jgi:acyl carrier protein
MEDFKEQFENILIDKFQVEREALKPETVFSSDLGADSLDMIELTLEFEKTFKITLPDDDQAERLKTVGEAERYLRNKLNNN